MPNSILLVFYWEFDLVIDSNCLNLCTKYICNTIQ